MPFTFSHPAIILPLYLLPANYLSMTGLIIGSMAPDFEYFIRMNVLSLYSHSLPGIFFFNLPVALLVCFLFHLVIKNSLIDSLPGFLKARLQKLKDFNWISYFKQYWYVVLISIIIGAASHIFWDSFTHADGYFVQRVSFLSDNYRLLDYNVPGYKIGQHLSTVAGGIFIIFFILHVPAQEDGFQTKRINTYWITVAIVTAIVMTGRLAGSEISIGIFVVTAIAGLVIGLIITPFLLKAVNINY